MPAKPPCVGYCSRPVSSGMFLCPACVAELRGHLADIAALWPELPATIARLARLGSDITSKGATEPLVFNFPASDVPFVLMNTVGTWARHVAESRPAELYADDLPALCRWLIDYAGWLGGQPEAEQAADELADCAALISRTVDLPAPRWYAGTCGAPVVSSAGSAACMADIYGVPGVATVRCSDCGAVYDAMARRRWLLALAVDTLAHAELAGRALAALGEPVTSAQIRGWARRGQLVRHGSDERGRPLYRVGDVIDLARARTKARLRQRAT